MLKYVSKFAIDILPSVAATVIGAYIVTTWINPKPAHDAAKASIASKAAPDSAGDTPGLAADKSAEAKPEASKPIKGIAAPPKDAASKDTTSAKAMDKAIDKTNPEKNAKLRAPEPATASAEPRHSVNVNEKTTAKASPIVTAPETTASIASTAVEDRRDASEMARSALERLRGSADGAKSEAPKPPEAARPSREAHAVEPQRPQVQPPAVEAATVNAVLPQPAILPMGPPINIAAPRYSDAAMGRDTARDDDARLVPPGEIPTMHRTAEAQGGRTTIADDVVSATRSVLRAVLPK